MRVTEVNMVGAFVGVSYYLMCILIFICRLAGRSEYGDWIGIVQFPIVVLLVLLLAVSVRFDRSTLYYVQVILMIVFVLLEILLDYILKIDFRRTLAVVIPYVVLFFAATGGMLGVISLCGRVWTVVSVILFFVMAALAFIQRAVTGM